MPPLIFLYFSQASNAEGPGPGLEAEEIVTIKTFSAMLILCILIVGVVHAETNTLITVSGSCIGSSVLASSNTAEIIRGIYSVESGVMRMHTTPGMFQFDLCNEVTSNGSSVQADSTRAMNYVGNGAFFSDTIYSFRTGRNCAEGAEHSGVFAELVCEAPDSCGDDCETDPGDAFCEEINAGTSAMFRSGSINTCYGISVVPKSGIQLNYEYLTGAPQYPGATGLTGVFGSKMTTFQIYGQTDDEGNQIPSLKTESTFAGRWSGTSTTSGQFRFDSIR